MDKALHAAYWLKTVEVRWAKSRVKIDLATDVFSSHQIDGGSRFLLRQMETADVRYGRVLDVGCGVGVLGLGLRVMGRAEQVVGFDRDAAAVAFAHHNAEQNGIDDVRLATGIAYEADAVGLQLFDAVVSNVPAKAGEGVHRLMLLGAGRLLKRGGEVWIVVVEPLAKRVETILADGGAEVRHKAGRGGHVVYRYCVGPGAPIPADPYRRGCASFGRGPGRYDMRTWHGLSEFDTLSIDTRIMLGLLGDAVRDRPMRGAAIVGSGQGHGAVSLSRLCGPETGLVVVNRDVLADRATAAHLQEAGHSGPVVRSVDAMLGPIEPAGPPVDWVVMQLNDGLPDKVSAGLIQRWLEAWPGTTLVLGGKAAYANRVSERVKRWGIRTIRAVKEKGFAGMVMEIAD